ncbi:hypothetical protein OC861_003895, partial [Tilletia horrida]
PKTDDPSVPKGSFWFVDESVEPASVRPRKPSAKSSGSASKTMRIKLVSAAEAGLRSSSGSKSGQSSGGKNQASILRVDATETDRDAEGETDVSDEEMSVVAGFDPPGGSLRAPATDGQRDAASADVKSKATPSATPSNVSTPASTPDPAVNAPHAAGGPATLPPALPQQPTTLSLTSWPSLPIATQDSLVPPSLHPGNGPIRSSAVAGFYRSRVRDASWIGRQLSDESSFAGTGCSSIPIHASVLDSATLCWNAAANEANDAFELVEPAAGGTASHGAT